MATLWITEYEGYGGLNPGVSRTTMRRFFANRQLPRRP